MYMDVPDGILAAVHYCIDLARAFLRILQPEAHKNPTNTCVISIFIVEHLTDPQVLNLSLRDVPKYLNITESKTDLNTDEKYSILSICVIRWGSAKYENYENAHFGVQTATKQRCLP